MVVENQFSWFTDNPWILLITTIGLLVMTGLAVFEGIKLFRDHHNRPQIQLKMIKHFEKTNDGKNKDLSFWVYVHNTGNGFLSHCKTKIRITNHSGSIDIIDKTGKKYQEEILDLSWGDENDLHDLQDIYPAKNEYGKFKLPLSVTVPTTKNESSFVNQELFSMKFLKPVEASWKRSPHYLKGIGKAVTVYFVFTIWINAEERSFKKRIRVVIPINVDFLEENHIVFEEKKRGTFFGDGFYSFLSLFKKYADEGSVGLSRPKIDIT